MAPTIITKLSDEPHPGKINLAALQATAIKNGVEQVKSACNWEDAHYDPEFQSALLALADSDSGA